MSAADPEASEGDAPAERELPPFGECYRLLFPVLLHLAGRVLRDQGAAEDVVQEVFVIGHRKHPAFSSQGLGAYRRFLYTVCRHLAWRHARRRRRDGAQQTAAPAPEAAGADREALDALIVQQALATLDERTHLVTVLYLIEGRTLEEIAAALGCSARTVHRTLEAGRESLRRALEGGA